ncbi:hypothetical protein BKN38_07000 [Helicobacter sp. CLO-3]|nr:hypothetical protein BA723_01665 [Helicobacter sp. CLO-3]OHU82527.1 hypothetical protein BKN38_07000 [Helicobacter sp. CLO-3]
MESSAQKRVIIVHGYGGDSKSHWFVWLKNELEKQGARVVAPDMPDSLSPTPKAWIAALRETIGDIDENTFIVAHSLGCISALRYIEGLDARERLGGVVLVGGFYEPLSILPKLDPFVAEPLQGAKLAKMIKNRVVLSAKDDKVVLTNLSENLAKAIDAEFIQLPSGGHFMKDEVGDKLPIVLELLHKQMGM